MGMIDPGFWKGRKVFLTGHTGFKGSWLSVWLEGLGADVTGFALAPPTSPSLFELAGLSKRMRSVLGDVRDLRAIEKALAESSPEIVIHMAAQPLVRLSYEDPLLTYATNVMGTANLLDAIRRCSFVRAVVVVTTDKCYENREWHWGYRENEALGGYDPYSSSKGAAELVCASYRSSFFNPRDYGTKHSTAIATARAGNVIGGGDWAKDRLIPDMVRAISQSEKVRIRSPHAIRPWQHVLEPISGYLMLAERLFSKGCDFAEAWNFGPYDSDARPVQWIVEKLCSTWPGAAGYELDASPQPHEASYLKLDCSKARARLGWAPVWNLNDALEKIVEWNVALEKGHDLHEVTMRQIEAFTAAADSQS